MRRGGYAFTALLSASLALAVPLAARAQPFQGVYVNLGAGYALAPDTNATPPSSFAGSGFQLERNGGFAGLGSLGYAFGNGFRLELEGNYRQSGLNGLSGSTTSTSGSGSLNSYGLMGNVLFDMDIGRSWLYPYIGGGVGYGWDSLSSARLSQTGTGFSSSDTSGGLAWQAIAGLSFQSPVSPPVGHRRISLPQHRRRRDLPRQHAHRPSQPDGRHPTRPRFPARRALCVRRHPATTANPGTHRRASPRAGA